MKITFSENKPHLYQSKKKTVKGLEKSEKIGYNMSNHLS